MFQLFGGDDQAAKRGAWEQDWRTFRGKASYALRFTEPGGPIGARVRKLIALATGGRALGRSIYQIRCERGAEIAQALGFSRATAEAIRSMDEHWDGGGYPGGLKGQNIPLLARIVGLAQVAEIFAEQDGPTAALTVVRERRGRWFDPDLVKAFAGVAADSTLWSQVASTELETEVSAVEPQAMQFAVDAGAARSDRRRLCVGCRREVAVYLRPFPARGRSRHVDGGALRPDGRRMRAHEARGAAARHRQAGRAEPHSRQAGESDATASGASCGFTRTTPIRFSNVFLCSASSRSTRAPITSGWTGVATIATCAAINCRSAPECSPRPTSSMPCLRTGRIEKGMPLERVCGMSRCRCGFRSVPRLRDGGKSRSGCVILVCLHEPPGFCS